MLAVDHLFASPAEPPANDAKGPVASSQVGEQCVDLVLGLELDYTSGCDVLVAALESVPETSARHCHDFVTDLHKAKGISDDLLLGAAVPLLDLTTNQSFEAG